MPVSRFLKSGSLMSSLNRRMVRWRSWYSSMSMLMNTFGLRLTASSYSGRRRSFSRSTEPSMSHWLSCATTDDAFTDTYVTRGLRMRLRMFLLRRCASSSPRTISPRRFRLSCSPDSLALSSVVLSASDSASRTRWPTIWRMRMRASGMTRFGRMGPKKAPAPIISALTRPRKAGSNSWLMVLRASAAVLSSSGRMTRSTKSIVNLMP